MSTTATATTSSGGSEEKVCTRCSPNLTSKLAMHIAHFSTGSCPLFPYDTSEEPEKVINKTQSFW